MDPIPVAVLGLADGPESCSGPGILAALSPDRFRRVGVVFDPAESGAYRPGLVDRVVLLPPPGSGAFLAALLELIAEEGLAALLPGGPAVAGALASVKAPLVAAGAALLAPAADRMADRKLVEVCREAGIAVLDRHLLEGDPGSALAQHSFLAPGVLLGTHGCRRRVTDSWEALRGLEVLRREGPVSIGAWNPLGAFEACAVAGPDGQLLGAAAVRVLADDERLRPWLAVTVENPEIVRVMERLCAALEATGPISALLLREGAGFRVVDVQPGFPVWIEVSLADGPDLVGLAVELAIGGAGVAATSASDLSTPAGILFSQTPDDLVVASDHPLRAQLGVEERS